MAVARRTILQGIGVLGASLGVPRWASATTLAALGLEELVAQSPLVVDTLPVERRSEWLTVGGTRRIVTITRLVHESVWRGPASAPSESEVLTWGGRIGEIGQKVHGEARLTIGEPLVLFLQDAAQSSWRVTGMAQGQFSVVGTGPDARLKRSSELPDLRGPTAGKRTAVERLHSLRRAEARKVVVELAQGLRP